MNRLLAGICLVSWGLCASHGALAQSLNIDLGTALGAGGIPLVTQGGPAAQPGVWNDLGKGTDLAVVGLDGLPTAVTVTVTATFATGNANTPILDENEKIGNDFIFSQSPVGWSIDIANLSDGAYDVYVIRPDSPVVTTGAMDVAGLSLAQLDYDNGPDPFDWILDETYSVAEVDVSGGSLALSGDGTGFVGLSGFQIVSVPESGPLLGGLAAGAVLAVCRALRRTR